MTDDDQTKDRRRERRARPTIAAGVRDTVRNSVSGALSEALNAASEAVESAAEAVRDIPTRSLTDAMEMRALAHPVRVALLDALRIEDSLTATEAADILGETPANCSFHLRTLAKYGFVEEAPGGVGRQRPWRRAVRSISFALDQEDPQATLAAGELARSQRQRIVRQAETYAQDWRTFPTEWNDASFSSDSVQFLTPDELAAIQQEVTELFRRHKGRVDNPGLRPAGALPVALAAWGHPLPVRGHTASDQAVDQPADPEDTATTDTATGDAAGGDARS